uniref:Uncharacterized protein n=1 Tax=Caudovirales sp. ctCiv1 TaxID=2826769 RepID=A0A8S5M8J0_9CAUD|nr:MAG TPA: hypothetical protein [Caudovirales sp. ctCiv1]
MVQLYSYILLSKNKKDRCSVLLLQFTLYIFCLYHSIS